MAWFSKHFNADFSLGQYSQVVLADVFDKVGFEAAIRDVTGIAHIAVNTQVLPNPELYIPQYIEEPLTVLRPLKQGRLSSPWF